MSFHQRSPAAVERGAAFWMDDEPFFDEDAALKGSRYATHT